MVDLTPVESSNVAEIGHDPETGELHVKFRSGARYAYGGVTPEMHQNVLDAESIGRHIARVIQPNRPVRKVDAE
jgi:hypothetical protein